MKQKNKNKNKHSLEKEMGTDKPKATTITMENNQKQITDEENDFVICFENGVVGIVEGRRRKEESWVEFWWVEKNNRRIKEQTTKIAIET